MLTKFILAVILHLAIIANSKISNPCDFCHLLAKKVQNSAPSWPLVPILQQIAVEYCVQKHLQDKNVCKGAVKQMTTYILTGLWRHYTNPHIVCQDLFVCSRQYVKRDLNKDIDQIIKDKPNKTWQKPTNRKTLKIVHISDLHPDLFYDPGAPVDCTEPVCCRKNVSAKGNSTKKAGYWGSVGKCDLPLQTFDLFLKQIKKLNPDAIIWTGDNTAHDIWQQSQSYNLNFTVILSQKIRAATNCTVMPAMGNHESYPVNVYDYSNKHDRQSVLHKGLGQAWKYWLDQKALNMQRQKGYFSMTYPHLNNLKLISINTQAGNDENWLLLQDISDPGNMLKWIQQELKESQKNNQFVYIIGHIPPKSNLNDWSMRFNALVDRYSYTIRGQFYGHTHSQHVSFFPKMNNRSKIDSAPLSSYYLISASLTTYSEYYPRYRVMEVDYDTLQVVDFTQYILDLKKYQTKEQNAQFQVFYKFKDSFKINDMSVEGGMTQLRNKLRDSPQWQKVYQYHRCGGLCQGSSGRGIFCDTTTSPQFHAECQNGTFKKSAFQKAAGPWRQYKHKD